MGVGGSWVKKTFKGDRPSRVFVCGLDIGEVFAFVAPTMKKHARVVCPFCLSWATASRDLAPTVTPRSMAVQDRRCEPLSEADPQPRSRKPSCAS